MDKVKVTIVIEAALDVPLQAIQLGMELAGGRVTAAGFGNFIEEWEEEFSARRRAEKRSKHCSERLDLLTRKSQRSSTPAEAGQSAPRLPQDAAPPLAHAPVEGADE